MARVKKIGPAPIVRTKKVKLLKGVIMAEGDDGVAGDIYELPLHIATQLISHGQAKETDEGDPAEFDETPESEKGDTFRTTTIESPTSRDPKPTRRGRSQDAAE